MLLEFFKKEKKISSEARLIYELDEKISNLLKNNVYISKQEYTLIIENYKTIISFFDGLIKNNLLKTYCKNNSITVDMVKRTLFNYENIASLVDEHNASFISSELRKEKEYLDNILIDVDSNISLDDEQRRVVLSDEDYTLVIAGAGAGKTTTMAAKVKYLIDKKDVRPEEILVVSYTNKAVNELKEKINKCLKLNVPISTFHSVGNAIIHKNDEELKKIVDSSRIFFIVQEYFKKEILIDNSLMKNLVLFFSTYFEYPSNCRDINELLEEMSKSTYTTMKSDLKDYCRKVIDKRTKKMRTIELEQVKSKEEVQIANFLYMNNIEYEYEPIYKYRVPLANKPYTPDFLIRQGDNIAYIEHFGITESGTNSNYTEEELKKYKKAINDKISIHKIHRTKLIYTFSKYNDSKHFILHLKKQLVDKGFVLNPKSEKHVLMKIVSDEENKYISKLLSLITRFIQLFKVNGYNSEQFDTFYQNSKNERTKLFLSICKKCYYEYQKNLSTINAIDFEDMINNSKKILTEVKSVGQKIHFKYIIVDEYQDISTQRFDLVQALHDVCDAKIIAVGDDFQSIYAFAGSDIKLFTDFKEKFGYADIHRIVNTYRNSQELIDIAGKFVEKNELQINKELKSNKHIKYPIIVNCFDKKDKIIEDLATAVELSLDNIVASNGINSKVLLLGRFGFDGYKLGQSSKFDFMDYGSKVISHKYPTLKITYMTVHASKGLGYDNVVILNMKNAVYGFPSKIENDPVMSLVIKDDRSYLYAEERRLFYVALTRTKNRVYLVTPSTYPSEFLLEILNDYEGIKVNGELELHVSNKVKSYKKCPICNYPMQFRFKESFGLPLYICMNDSEMCGFMTNEYNANNLEIMKCDKCIDGYLIVKKGIANEYFLGCTNYKSDGTGCNRTISQKEFEINYSRKKYGKM